MFTITLRDHIMVAHSLNGEIFGLAQNLHGATFIVDVEFHAKKLNENGIVIEVDLAKSIIHKVLSRYNYKNLDELDEFKGMNTTVEFLSQAIFDQVKKELENDGSIIFGKNGICSIKVALKESHIAFASFQDDLEVL